MFKLFKFSVQVISPFCSQEPSCSSQEGTVTVVNHYEMYLAKIPQDIVAANFYLHFLSDYHKENWHMCQPVRRNTLSKVVCNLAKNAGAGDMNE